MFVYACLFWIWSWKYTEASLVTFGTFCSLYNGLATHSTCKSSKHFLKQYIFWPALSSVHTFRGSTHMHKKLYLYDFDQTDLPPKPPNLNSHCQGRRNSGGHDAWTWGGRNVDFVTLQIDPKGLNLMRLGGMLEKYRASVLTCLLGSCFFPLCFISGYIDPSFTYPIKLPFLGAVLSAVWWFGIDHWVHEVEVFLFGWPESRRIKTWWQNIWFDGIKWWFYGDFIWLYVIFRVAFFFDRMLCMLRDFLP